MRKKTFSLAALLGLVMTAVIAIVGRIPADATTCGSNTITLALESNMNGGNGGLARADNTTARGTGGGAKAAGTNVVIASVTTSGAPDPSKTVLFFTDDDGSSANPPSVATSGGAGQPSPPPAPGSYKTTIHAGVTSDVVDTVTAQIANTSCFATLGIKQFGRASKVAVAFATNPVPVSPGPSEYTPPSDTVTATITDSKDFKVNDETLNFSCCTNINPSGADMDAFGDPPPAAAPTSPQTKAGSNKFDGTYTVPAYASTSPSQQTFTGAISGGPSDGINGTGQLVQYGDPTSVSITVNPNPVAANGVSVSTATARVEDSAGNPVPGTTVTFTAIGSPPVATDPGAADTGADGTVTSQVGPSSNAQTVQVYATISCTNPCTPQDHVPLTFEPPQPKTVRVTLNPFSIPADGKSTTTATATVTDQSGAPIKGCTVKFTRSGDPSAQIPATDKGDGTYTATLVAASTAKSEVVSASATNSAGSANNIFPAQLVETAVATPAAPAQGYSLVGEDGSLYAFGTAKNVGDMKGTKLNAPIIGVAYAPGGNGYWLVAKDGGIFSFGTAKFYGSMGNQKLNSPVLGMAATPSGLGYWLFAGDGGIFSFGDAKFYGSMGDKKLNSPVVNMEPIASGGGYWLVAGDGGIFSFNTQFFGSMGNQHINQPVFDMTSTDTDKGYWLVARDGGVFSFGDAAPKFYGSAVNSTPAPTKIIGMDSTPDSLGYWIADADGKVYNFGDGKALGDRYGQSNPAPMVAFAAVPA